MGRNGVKKRRPLVPPPMTSLRKARVVTSEFHRLTRQLQDASQEGRRADAARLAQEVERLGGRAAYQEASALTTARHRTAKFVFAALTRHGLRPGRGEPPLPLLEVGAVNTQLLSVPWLAVRAIDLRSTHPRIEQRDFFDLPAAGEYAAVVCAMVLNCVPTAVGRGLMIRGVREHLRDGGVAFFMLPLRCLNRSPFTTHAVFTEALAAAGFELLETKESPKVVFLCARAVALPDKRARRAAEARFCDPPPVVARGAELTNDFAVAFAPQA